MVFGSAVAVSKNPVTGVLVSGVREFEFTYKRQMAELAPLHPVEEPLTVNKLLAAASRAV